MHEINDENVESLVGCRNGGRAYCETFLFGLTLSATKSKRHMTGAPVGLPIASPDTHGAACPLGGVTTFSTSVEGDFMATQKHIKDIGE